MLVPLTIIPLFGFSVAKDFKNLLMSYCLDFPDEVGYLVVRSLMPSSRVATEEVRANSALPV